MKNNPFFLILSIICLTSVGSNLNAISSVKSDSVSVKIADFPNKQSQKVKPVLLRGVHVTLMNGELVEGKFLKVENGNLYLVNNNVEEIFLHNHFEELIVIPLTNVDTIQKSPKLAIVGIFFFAAFMSIGLLLFSLLRSDGDLRSQAKKEELRKQGIGSFILGGITGLFTLFANFPRKLRIKGDPSRYKPRKVKRFQPYEGLTSDSE